MNAQTSKRQLDEFSFESVFANNEAIANQKGTAEYGNAILGIFERLHCSQMYNVDRNSHSMVVVLVLLVRPHLEGGHHENVEAGVRSGQPVLVTVLH